ncbi:class II major histocompatibility complex transactivator [Rhinolophus ferrumequinum]|uniref:Class II major histocompatibility complex transactivator n=1 Tax=Rhinolophus ferrumequinum TaxID=59479 RepID=A0A7J7R8G8_RHIFE|nr:class II major histocompatibility complex transactivator [Rhinolophus ferrumequinum]
MRCLAPRPARSYLPEPQGSGQCAAMELEPLEGGYLELLNSSADPLQLYHLCDQLDLAGEEEIELCSEPDTDTINCEQFSRLLCAIEDDEETREAYANIAELDQYVFQDSQFEGLSKDIFIEHIGLEEIISESVDVLEEAGQKRQKRPFPEELPADLKHRKLAPPSGSLLSCLSLPAGSFQIIPALPTLPQGLWQISGAGTGVSSIVIYQGEMPQTSQAPPSSSPAVHSLPKTPERPGSTSPFAPSAADDLPSMPEAALTSRASTTEDELSPTQCPAASEVSSKLPKWPARSLCLGLRPSLHRAALSDTVELWESLRQHGEAKLLQAVEDKFTIEPFKAKSMKDVEDLGNLVQIQRTTSSSEDAARELPAVRDLKKLEFALGPVLGPQAFPKLVRILEAFSSLQHLDLDSLSENKIGDEGVAQLSATFPQLKALETLNLSQNSITDVGACKLAEALPSLAASLLRLSLYNNCICDVGAESLAHVLPDMVSLRILDVQYNKFTASGAQQLTASLRKCPHVETLAMWTPTIPFGVQEHLQQLDSRISLR